MNVNDYGVIIQYGTSFNMSGFSSLTFTFTKPSGALLTVTGSLGLVTIDTPLGQFLAQTYATYTFKSGDVDQAGAWEARLTYRDTSPAQYISNPAYFTVGI